MKKFALLFFLIINTSAYAEICPAQKTCDYLVYNHSPRIIKIINLERGHIYQCHFTNIKSQNPGTIDIRSYDNHHSPGLTVTLNSGSTNLPTSVIVDTINSQTNLGYFYVTLYPHLFINYNQVSISCEINQ